MGLIDSSTLLIRFLLEMPFALARWYGMHPEHQKQIIVALKSPIVLAQWKPGALSQADTKTTKRSTADKREIEL